ncbi:unnamed protein product [Microthlaspi erraticum]|uniref:Uncharacterized protein n=1 Tax=Microthlaspi erraticum TaxID=1685480 RepID=A0A6D2JU57_9BRAS|nr:unnamed protein product [Microthlaspi erraticum]CAA7053151.1 unnamed protein product [Microthlaspi erraticum]
MDFIETQHQDRQMTGRTHSAGQESNWLRSAFTRTDPHARIGRPGRKWTTVDPEYHLKADPDGRPHPLHGRPEVCEQEVHLCSFDYSRPVSPQPTCGRPRAL